VASSAWTGSVSLPPMRRAIHANRAQTIATALLFSKGARTFVSFDLNFGTSRRARSQKSCWPRGGDAAVPGGQVVFDLFLKIGFDAFHLTARMA
jgi:hypothetical protein